MKSLFFVVLSCIAAGSYAQDGTLAKSNQTGTVPAALITNDATYWTISTVSTTGYVNTTPGAYYNTYKSGGGMLVKFKFKPNNRYEFMLYVQSNMYNNDIETWTQVEGTVTFTKDDKGQNIFITRAEKGSYRIVKNGTTTNRPIAESELKGQHSSTYLWEKTRFADDPNNIYLLTVDLKQHPKADVNTPKSIDPSWVSRFHIPVAQGKK
ncbi:MAG: hypothetical protein INR73_10975 [Williamsia sp.]|nr:hypothetical protein [Williamsia sp.]